jgi:hypothetical protein
MTVVEGNAEQGWEQYTEEPFVPTELENKRLLQMENFCSQCQDLFVDRNHAYGDAISDTGLLGAVVTLVGDTGRLRRLVLPVINVKLLNTKAIQDTLLDIHNYSAIALMMIEDNNLVGK